jgi:hypothetical protein
MHFAECSALSEEWILNNNNNKAVVFLRVLVTAVTSKISKTNYPFRPPLSQPKKNFMVGNIQITIVFFLDGFVTLGSGPRLPLPPPMSRL